MNEYVIGIDFGTLSCRAVIVKTCNGSTVGEAVSEYTHGVIENKLPDGTEIPEGFALQDPCDYLESLSAAVKGAMKGSGVSPEEIRGIGIDFTSCTILPVDEKFEPLCKHDEFSHDPHAFVKLWKHHGAVNEAKELTSLIYGENNHGYSGTEISPEHGLPKILETLRKAPEVYDKTYRFMEAGDWINTVLTGTECHSAQFAGFKLLWKKEKGYPEAALLGKAEQKLGEISGTKLSENISPVSERAGTLGEKGALLTGLPAGIPVAEACIDAHAAIPGVGATESGDMVITLGTSACHMLHSTGYKDIPGAFGSMKDGAVPGLYTYESGQSAVGDIFSWFINNSVSAVYEKEAAKRGISIHALLSEKASLLPPGGHGVVAVDWLNGCRTPLNDAKLSGTVYGLRLSTKPEELYRAWLEAAAFGTRRIIENYEEHGLPVTRIYLCGGIAQKNPLFVQILADAAGKSMHIITEKQCAALGSAVYAAAAAGLYPNVREAAKAMHSPILRTVTPKEDYDPVYKKYRALADMAQSFSF